MSVDIESPGGSASALEAAVRKLAYQRRGAQVTLASALTAQNFTSTADIIPWDAETYDTDGCHDNVTDNSRLTVPSGFTKARISSCLRLANRTGSTTDFNFGYILKNGSVAYDGVGRGYCATQGTAQAWMVTTGIIDVTAGDYFEVSILVQSDTSVDLQTTSWFEMELFV